MVLFPDRTPIGIWDCRNVKERNVKDDTVVDIFKRLGERVVQASGI